LRKAKSSTSPLLAITFVGLLSASDAVLSQAGSQPPIRFDSTPRLAYLNSGAMGDVTSGAGREVEQAVYPAGVLQLPSSSKYLLWAELEAGRLSVLENQGEAGFTLLRHIPISIGKNGVGKEEEGDKRTPLGVYRFTTFLQDENLDDYYGLGAYPINYPNVHDQLLGRTGHGIWLHGLPKSVTERPFLDSDGCVVVDNQSLLDLAQEIAPGQTHLVIGRAPIRWVTAQERAEVRASLGSAFEDWRSAWESRNNDEYLSYYADDFRDFSLDKSGWSTYKTRVNDSKRFIEVKVSEVAMLASPETPDMVDVRFYQSYVSNNYNWKGWKHQLWRLDDSGWKIVYEGNG
jgi:murein L,D-transpeptidase YafK